MSFVGAVFCGPQGEDDGRGLYCFCPKQCRQLFATSKHRTISCRMSRPSHNLSGNGRAATSWDTGVTNKDLGASRERTKC